MNRALFTQADVTRACTGVMKAGLKVYGVNIGRNGDIQVITVEDGVERPESASFEPEDGLERWAREYATKYAERQKDPQP